MRIFNLLIFIAIAVLACKSGSESRKSSPQPPANETAVTSAGAQGVGDTLPPTRVIRSAQGLELESRTEPFMRELQAGDLPAFQRGIRAYLADSMLVATRYLDSASRRDKLNWEVWYYLGMASYLAGDGNAAVRAFTRAESKSLPPTLHIRLRWYLANSYALSDNTVRSETILSWIIQQNREYKSEAERLLEAIRRLPKPETLPGE